MPGLRSYVVTSAEAGRRLDHCLRARLPELSRRDVLKMLDEGHVRLNGRLALKGTQVQPGDQIELISVPPTPGPAPDSSTPLRIIYEDANLIAVDKPAGIPSHALRAGERNTVVSALLSRYPELRGVGYRELESGLLHRLDNDTSGLLLAVRNPPMFEYLRAAHEAGAFDKRYLALVSGHPSPQPLRAYLRADRQRVRVRSEPFDGAKPIRSELLSAAAYGTFSLVCVRVALAGRHQVRAQLAALGHPIVGDRLYGGHPLPGLSRHFLHASELCFPYQGQRLLLRAPLASELQAVLERLAAPAD